MSGSAPVGTVTNAPAPLATPTVQWPQDLAGECRRRFDLLNRVRSDAVLLEISKAHYQNNPVDFIGDWVWTYDPRQQPSHLPLVLWPRQVEFVEWLHARFEQSEDGLVEKSRDMGVTWLCISYALWAWLHIPGFKAGFGSRKEALVDRLGDPDCIFEKVRYALGRIPPELLPSGFAVRTHCNFMKLTNPETGSTLTGEAGDNIGRGGRNTIYFVDEAAFIERPDRVDAALSQNTNCRIDVSTPNGVGNPFHRRRHGGAVPVFVLDWREDPRKDEAWYEAQKAKLDPMILAQEVDRDYEASAEDILIPGRWVAAAMGLDLLPSGPRHAGLDVADEGPDSNALAIVRGPVVERIESWKEGTTTQTARKAVQICNEVGAAELRYDNIGVGAGVRGELAEMTLRFDVHGINTGSRKLRGWYEPPGEDAPGRLNKDMFLNRKALGWWQLRKRFQKTWERVNDVKHHPVEECISLPRDAYQLQTELSGPKYLRTETGLIQVESKKSMSNRGLKSPNLADALVLAYMPLPGFSPVW